MEIPIASEPNRDPQRDKKERNASICACCTWLIVFLFATIVLTMPSEMTDSPEAALGYLVLFPVMLVLFVLSIYKMGKAALNAYKAA